ncbi:MAG TPA: sporulation integral membrane protein YtvI [Desulfitobacteriaceae bacterium]|nr:sporulation integral membrane protein YtvI [Desulfitobacteriaceae bacterium]
MDFFNSRELGILNQITRTFFRRTTKFLGFWLLVFLIIWLISRFIYLFLPFILAFIMTAMISPLKNLLIRKFKMPLNISVLTAMILELGGISLLLLFMINREIKEIQDIYLRWPHYEGVLKQILNNWLLNIQNAFLNIPSDYLDIINNSISSIINSVPHLLSQGVTLAIAIPELIIILVIALVATYFMSKNSKRYTRDIVNIFPREWRENLFELGSDFSRALAGFIKAEFIIFLIMMFCSILGLYFLHTKYFISMGIITGLFGILPVLGVGIVLVPWALFAYIAGNNMFAIELLLLTTAITVIRHVIEPKILGDNVGLDPLFVLISMYIGLETTGIIGLLIGPFILIAYQALRKAGVFSNL